MAMFYFFRSGLNLSKCVYFRLDIRFKKLNSDHLYRDGKSEFQIENKESEPQIGWKISVTSIRDQSITSFSSCLDPPIIEKESSSPD